MVVVHFTIAMCLCAFACVPSGVLNEIRRLTINFSYRRIRLGCESVCVCVLYKLLNRTLGASAATAINENGMAQRGRLLLLWDFFCRCIAVPHKNGK